MYDLHFYVGGWVVLLDHLFEVAELVPLVADQLVSLVVVLYVDVDPVGRLHLHVVLHLLALVFGRLVLERGEERGRAAGLRLDHDGVLVVAYSHNLKVLVNLLRVVVLVEGYESLLVHVVFKLELHVGVVHVLIIKHVVPRHIVISWAGEVCVV